MPEDFYDPAPGSRGKARLKKSSAFKKCKALVGGFENKRKKFLERYQDEVQNSITPSQRKNAEKKWNMWYNKEDSYSIHLENIDELK